MRMVFPGYVWRVVGVELSWLDGCWPCAWLGGVSSSIAAGVRLWQQAAMEPGLIAGELASLGALSLSQPP